ncbi:MAG TPA: hypothetical protein VFS97_11335 [Nitrososphaeraceae archaeon]|nr:hypothetical protein [Nitrososphaeraceae archaeon]
MSGGFFRNSFYPFFPWQQEERHKNKTIKSQYGLNGSQSAENNAESILKMRLAKGEITPEAYSSLRKLIAK